MDDKAGQLRRTIAEREAELAELRARLAEASSEAAGGAAGDDGRPLPDDEVRRYGRQMIVPGLGLQAQLRLRRARVLVVGAGGLGCPAAAYLAGAGVGMLGLADADEVELSNLHRQIAHSTARVGMAKVRSAVAYLRELNPTVTYRSHEEHLSAQNAERIVSEYDLVLDCTDHPAPRYLVSDACVLLRKPLVSASAFQTSGQLVVLNSPPGRGPCYRCVFPRPPPPETVVGCGEGGILGPVVGLMGVLQALEAIKLIAGPAADGADAAAPHAGTPKAAAGAGGRAHRQSPPPTMLLFSAVLDGSPSFRSVRMRGKRDDCLACSGRGGLTLERLRSSMDYAQFCGVAEPVALLRPEERVSAQRYRDIGAARPDHVLLDVRPEEHFSLGSLPGAVNVPVHRFSRGGDVCDVLPPEARARRDVPIYVVCRVGNDSQIVARKLKDLGLDNQGQRFIGDIEGGVRAWRDAVDPTLPFI